MRSESSAWPWPDKKRVFLEHFGMIAPGKIQGAGAQPNVRKHVRNKHLQSAEQLGDSNGHNFRAQKPNINSRTGDASASQ
jgi:hypothetical protein